MWRNQSSFHNFSEITIASSEVVTLPWHECHFQVLPRATTVLCSIPSVKKSPLHFLSFFKQQASGWCRFPGFLDEFGKTINGKVISKLTRLSFRPCHNLHGLVGIYKFNHPIPSAYLDPCITGGFSFKACTMIGIRDGSAAQPGVACSIPSAHGWHHHVPGMGINEAQTYDLVRATSMNSTSPFSSMGKSPVRRLTTFLQLVHLFIQYRVGHAIFARSLLLHSGRKFFISTLPAFSTLR